MDPLGNMFMEVRGLARQNHTERCKARLDFPALQPDLFVEGAEQDAQTCLRAYYTSTYHLALVSQRHSAIETESEGVAGRFAATSRVVSGRAGEPQEQQDERRQLDCASYITTNGIRCSTCVLDPPKRSFKQPSISPAQRKVPEKASTAWRSTASRTRARL